LQRFILRNQEIAKAQEAAAKNVPA
jgi:hypothetical protein